MSLRSVKFMTRNHITLTKMFVEAENVLRSMQHARSAELGDIQIAFTNVMMTHAISCLDEISFFTSNASAHAIAL
ncbi:hypothetical protein DVT68_19065 [Dyella solisilvae]|uniref:Uncharacterized protein n=1 Tax=Dyella solisilvae TaxID=1920168 RepID=A0A370K2W8_9GAMM|nr:hypothetical protein [Dyella solisilvae]RDI96992.1 hypothetical protein DVT68_19065 [Dyella solisilvae]